MLLQHQRLPAWPLQPRRINEPDQVRLLRAALPLKGQRPQQLVLGLRRQHVVAGQRLQRLVAQRVRVERARVALDGGVAAAELLVDLAAQQADRRLRVASVQSEFGCVVEAGGENLVARVGARLVPVKDLQRLLVLFRREKRSVFLM